MDPIQGLDWGTYYWFLTQRNSGFSLEPVMEGLNALGNELVLAAVALATLGLLLKQGNTRRAGLHRAGIFLASIVLSLGVILAVKFLVHRPRPADADVAGLLAPTAGSPSFPCEAAFLSSLVLTVLALVVAARCSAAWRRWAIYAEAFVLVMAIGASQLYLGLHFLTDVLAGWAGGTMLALAGERMTSSSSSSK